MDCSTFGGGGETVGWLRGFAFWVMVAVWAYCLMAHLLVVAGLSPPLIDPMIVGAIGAAAISVLVWPYRSSPSLNRPPPWYAAALAAASLLCAMWPMVVGSGVPNTHPFAIFSDTGVPSGEPGDRHLHSHSRRIRSLTEEEYQRIWQWMVVQQSAFAAGFAGVVLGYLLHLRRLGVAPNNKFGGVTQ